MRDIENKSSEKRVASLKKNTIYSIIKTCSTIAFPLITFPYISRVLSVDNVGKVNFGNSIVNYISLIASLGISTYAIRECSKIKNDKEELSATASEIISINVITTAVAYFILALLLVFWHKLYDYEFLIIIQSTAVIFSTLGADWINTAMEDFRFITLRTFSFQLISLICIFLFVHKPEDYIIYAIISVLSASGGNLANILYRKKYCNTRFTLSIDWKRRLPPILTLFAMILSQTFLASIDTTMLGVMKGDTAVGLYSVANKTNNIIVQIVASITWVVMPQLSSAFSKRDYKKINKSLRYAYNFSITIGIPCIIGMLIMAPEIINVVGGDAYSGANNCLRIFAVSLFFIVLNNYYGNVVLLSSFREKQFMIACMLAAIVNLITNYIFIPLYGIEAAAMTTAIAQAIMYFVSKYNPDKHIDIGNKFTAFLQPTLASLPIAIICIISKQFINNMPVRLIAAVFFSAITYIAILMIFKNEFILSFLIPIKAKLFKNKH